MNTFFSFHAFHWNIIFGISYSDYIAEIENSRNTLIQLDRYSKNKAKFGGNTFVFTIMKLEKYSYRFSPFLFSSFYDFSRIWTRSSKRHVCLYPIRKFILVLPARRNLLKTIATNLQSSNLSTFGKYPP